MNPYKDTRTWIILLEKHLEYPVFKVVNPWLQNRPWSICRSDERHQECPRAWGVVPGCPGSRGAWHRKLWRRPRTGGPFLWWWHQTGRGMLYNSLLYSQGQSQQKSPSAGKHLTKSLYCPSKLFQLVCRVENATCSISEPFGESFFKEQQGDPSKLSETVGNWRLWRVWSVEASLQCVLFANGSAVGGLISPPKTCATRTSPFRHWHSEYLMSYWKAWTDRHNL